MGDFNIYVNDEIKSVKSKTYLIPKKATSVAIPVNKKGEKSVVLETSVTIKT